VNDTSVLLGKPNVCGSIFRFEGQASVLATADGPCYRCLFREPPPPGLVPSCAEGGVLGVLPGLVGVIQATETIKLLTGVGEPLIGRLLLIDALSMKFRTLKLHKDPLCPACGTREIQALQDYDRFCGLDAEAVHEGELAELLPTELSERLAQGHDIDLIDVREPQEWALGHIPGARLIPLGTLPSALSALDSARDVVVYCKGGVRSARAARALQAAGFRRVWNLTGGILRWSKDVDPTIPQY
jgi:adenylyltransferase/sulfurtransferase